MADACAVPPPSVPGLAHVPLAVSLASSDSACSINHTLWHALDFLAPSTQLVVHIGCGSPATQAERRALGAISPRVLINPLCESVNAKDGTILHAHLLNVRLLSAAPPQAVLLASADMRWLARGVEAAATSRVSSVFEASWLPWEQALEALPPNRRAAFGRGSYAAELRALAGAAGGRLVVQKHEGSFYPWAVLRDFLSRMCARGSLRRLRALRATVLRPGLALAPEECLLPTFAAAALNSSGRRRRSVRDIDENLDNDKGVVCGFRADLRGSCGPGNRRVRIVPVRVCAADCSGFRRKRPCIGSVVFAQKDESEGAHSVC